ncbi:MULTISPECIES: polyisoprenyl-teichoic acid--peptidoglycan teichoic acid transferase TagU [Bacillus cereus group]|uniref:polyisoprenyl-teichoic acid--peptidoglycan teichoic acid transferase TagU n=1 Tax=Bacillus cereus group TaxID=86661 RepID=UPI001E3287AD|nr:MULTISPECIES: LytR family transcriptional regulator [Bacillus cereus group]HDR7253092.1 LytR family transcriptional regulator [Bacillus pacificus]MCC2399297.1 LytR family transcriptional regulator [Bacillus paranthracis]MCU5122630.1 LytR family transcriptional regulator [Bacillus paranthracis]MCU5368354.1 LytR family transcriptional regulator [Bacillus paranthracis]MCU5606950.1 LytR family transcriptional regulator [Bacillus paranthracis]
MRKKIIFVLLGTLALILIAGGIYAYNVYSKVSNTLDAVHQPLNRDKSEKREQKVNISDQKPISILLMGTDQRESETSRSDSLMLFTLNPQKKSMKITSIPRDTYTEIIGKGKKDKINHAYAFGGVDMSVKTVENFLNLPVDHYIEVNMAGFKDIVDAVGGVDVNNDLDFTSRDTHFAKGEIHLDGEKALKYTRMRYEDPRGDFGRQMRQRQVIQAVIKKGASVSSLASYGDVLKAIEKNVKTSLTQDQMFEIQKNYKDCMENSEEIQIPGDGHKAADGIWYYYVPDAAKQDITNKLRAHLEVTK